MSEKIDSPSGLASSLDPPPAPDGGARAWSVAAGAGLVSFATLGFANSFGIFQAYYLAHQLADRSPSDVAWIGSLSAFFQFSTGAVAGPLFDRFGAARVILPSAAACVAAVFLTSACREYYQFVLAQGVLLGLATGGLQSPSLAAVGQYFDRRRAAALGLVLAGSSVGGVVFPLALGRMLGDGGGGGGGGGGGDDHGRLSFGWSVRVVGFVLLAALAVACATVRGRLPPRPTRFWIGAAFRQPAYATLLAALLLLFLGMFMPLFFLPSYAEARGGMSAARAADLVAITNAASALGRIGPGLLADRAGRFNVLVAGGLATAVCTLCMTRATAPAGHYVYAVAFGAASGTIVSGAAAAVAVCVRDPRDLGTYLGMALGLASVAALIGPPISGRLLRVGDHSYLPATLFSGIACLVGSFVAWAAKAGTPQGVWGRV